MLSVDRVKELVSYNPDTGELFAIKSSGNRASGSKLGKPRKDGYSRIAIDGVYVYTHRVAFAIYYGYWPEFVDHANGNRADNRAINLRQATIFENNRNAAGKRGSASCFRGVSKRGKSRWRARIRTSDGRHLFIKESKSEVECAYLYDLAAIEHHGEFARTNFLPLVR